jgi:ABC-type dipeptide/oligopeptide/nickel transport system permease component
VIPYLLRRLCLLVPVLLGVTLIVFLAVRILPGDAALFLAGEDPRQETIERIRRDLALDQPLYVQFGLYLKSLLQGDLGRSLKTQRLVRDELGQRLAATAQLALAAMALATLLGVSAGVISATRPYSLFDNVSMIGALLGHSMPVFWFGLLLIMFFAVNLKWLPAGGNRGPEYLVLPAVALGVSAAGLIARMTRSAMLEVLQADYVRTARSKGLAERAVISRHALRSALIPVVTIVSLQTGQLLGGAVITEAVFAWPGLGTLVVESILTRDYTVLQGAVLVFAMSFALVNLLADVLYAVLDPRVRYGS